MLEADSVGAPLCKCARFLFFGSVLFRVWWVLGVVGCLFFVVYFLFLFFVVWILWIIWVVGCLVVCFLGFGFLGFGGFTSLLNSFSGKHEGLMWDPSLSEI